MESIVFTDLEIQEMRQRCMRDAEQRVTHELAEEMKRSIVRETARTVRTDMQIILKKLASEAFSTDRISRIIEEEIALLIKDHYGRRPFSDMINSSITKIVEAQAEALKKEFSSHLYSALQNYLRDKNDLSVTSCT